MFIAEMQKNPPGRSTISSMVFSTEAPPQHQLTTAPTGQWAALHLKYVGNLHVITADDVNIDHAVHAHLHKYNNIEI